MHEDVSIAGKRQQGRAGRRLLEVEHNAALAAIDVEEHPAARLVATWREVARGVAIRAFDLNHVSAQIGENLSRVWPHEHACQVENFHARQRALAGSAAHAAAALAMRLARPRLVRTCEREVRSCWFI